MKRKWIFFIAPPALVLFIGICGEVIMHLWNWLLPSLFGWRAITFWQSLGLLLLSRILFGSWHGGRDRSGHRRDRTERWERMTPEEREKFRQGLGARCGFGAGGFRPHDSEPGTPA